MPTLHAGRTKVGRACYDAPNALALTCGQDLDPVPVEKRTWGALDYWSYWCSDMLAPRESSLPSALTED